MKKKKVGDSKEAGQTAVENAHSWLDVVDGGGYGQSWDLAAKPLRAAFTRAKWEDAIATVRTSAGAVENRDLKSAEYKTSLPEAPDDEYYILQIGTAFEQKAEATEIIVMRLEEDASWRVATYLVK